MRHLLYSTPPSPSSSGQDIALSRRRHGFESRWGHHRVQARFRHRSRAFFCRGTGTRTRFAGRRGCGNARAFPSERARAADAARSRGRRRRTRVPLGAPSSASPVPSSEPGFLLPRHRDSNPLGSRGCGNARAFPSERARAADAARSRGRRRRTRVPLGAPLSASPVPSSEPGFLLPRRRDSNPLGSRGCGNARAFPERACEGPQGPEAADAGGGRGGDPVGGTIECKPGSVIGAGLSPAAAPRVSRGR